MLFGQPLQLDAFIAKNVPECFGQHVLSGLVFLNFFSLLYDVTLLIFTAIMSKYLLKNIPPKLTLSLLLLTSM
jgi:hypothetical protein